MIELMKKHYALILKSNQKNSKSKFLDKWTLRVFWMQDFVDALHTAVMMQAEKDTLRKGMFMFKIITRSVKEWLTNSERNLQIESDHFKYIRPPQESQLNNSYSGYWTLQEIDLINASMEHVPLNLILKSAQYYRALNMLDVRLYSFEDVNSHVQVSRMLHKPLSHHKHLRFLILMMKQWSAQVKDRWKREKRIQLGEHYAMVEVMWTPWYGLALPTVYTLESMKGFAANSLLDYVNFGLKGITLAITTAGFQEGIALWDDYLSSLYIILQSIHPSPVPALRRIHKQYRKFLELWYLPKIRASMMKLQGYRTQELVSYTLGSSEWKVFVLIELEELNGKGGLHTMIVDFVNSL